MAKNKLLHSKEFLTQLHELAASYRTAIEAVADLTGVVRRLTPIECERLMGFADNYIQIPYRGKSAEQCPKTQRYKALGNSMAVPVMHWIGERIMWALHSNDELNAKVNKGNPMTMTTLIMTIL